MDLLKSFFLALFLLASPARAQTVLYVDPAAPPGGNGASWCTAFQDLQDALAVVQPPALIQVAEGIYLPDQGSGDPARSFHLRNGVSILGGFAGCGAPDPDERDLLAHPSTLSGSLGGGVSSLHVVMADAWIDPSAVLDGLRVTGGRATGTSLADQEGAGMLCLGSPKLHDCTFEGNLADEDGGGMWNGGDPVLDTCTFRDNIAGNLGFSGLGGGGLSNAGRISLTHCAFLGNLSFFYGGGLENQAAGIEILDCLFQTNEALFGGAGSDNGAGVVFHNCRFLGNQGDMGYGGGAWEGAGSLYEDCTFEGNFAASGGAAACGSGKPVFRRCVFHDNLADDGHGSGDGGGLMARGELVVEKCLFLENQAGVGGGIAGAMGFGGGMSIPSGQAALRDCRFQQNRSNIAGGFGGQGRLVNCIFDRNSTFQGNYSGAADAGAFQGSGELIHCTLVGNTALDHFGGVDPRTGTVLRNCILWENQDVDGEGESSQIGSWASPILDHCLVMGWTGQLGGQGNFAARPRFVQGSRGDYHLLAASPCIDAGNASLLSGLADADFEGDPRPSFHGVDIGADEFHRHLYVMGDFVPGGLITVKFIGRPGAVPVRLDLGSGVLDTPQSTPHGDWYLASVVARKNFGLVQPNGLRSMPQVLPQDASGTLPLQGRIGNWFTNLFVIQVH